MIKYSVIKKAEANRDAIVVKDFKSAYVTLKSLNHDKSIRFHMENFNHFFASANSITISK